LQYTHITGEREGYNTTQLERLHDISTTLKKKIPPNNNKKHGKNNTHGNELKS